MSAATGVPIDSIQRRVSHMLLPVIGRDLPDGAPINDRIAANSKRWIVGTRGSLKRDGQTRPCLIHSKESGIPLHLHERLSCLVGPQSMRTTGLPGSTVSWALGDSDAARPDGYACSTLMSS